MNTLAWFSVVCGTVAFVGLVIATILDIRRYRRQWKDEK